jgi:hypothetical protein
VGPAARAAGQTTVDVAPVPGPVTGVRSHRGKPLLFLDGQPYSTLVFRDLCATRRIRFFGSGGRNGSLIFTKAAGLPRWTALG